MYVITKDEYEAVKKAARANSNKRVDRRLQAVMLRHEGASDRDIAQKLGYSTKRVSQLCSEFKRVGLDEYARRKYGGNHRSMGFDEEKEILAGFAEAASRGEAVTALGIKAAFDERLGRDTGRGYIYMLLARHKWRVAMPRGRHPKKASDEAVEASKKLTLRSRSSM